MNEMTFCTFAKMTYHNEIEITDKYWQLEIPKFFTFV